MNHSDQYLPPPSRKMLPDIPFENKLLRVANFLKKLVMLVESITNRKHIFVPGNTFSHLYLTFGVKHKTNSHHFCFITSVRKQKPY